MKKSLLSLLFILVFSILALSACNGVYNDSPTPPPAEDETTEGLEFILKEDGTYAVAVGTLLEEEVIEIPAEYNGKRVTEIAERGFQQTAVKRIVIPDGLKTVGASAFRGCENLTRINLPDTVETVGSHAFYNCKSLATASLSNQLKTLGAFAFYNCKVLGAVSLPEGLEAIGENAFFNCTALTSITVPDSVTSIGVSVFKGCENLTSLSVPFIGNGRSSATTSFLSYFFGGTSAADNKYDVPEKLVTVAVTDCTLLGASAFKDCARIKALSLPETLTSVGAGAFEGCVGIETVIVSDLGRWCGVDFASADANPLAAGATLYQGNAVVTMLTVPETVSAIKPYAFYNCKSINSLIVKNGATSIGASAFEGCENIHSVIIAETVSRIGASAFKGCAQMESLTVPFVGAELDGSINTHLSYIFGGRDRDDNELFVPATLQYVTVTKSTVIGYAAFYGCKNIHNITLPDSLLTIESAAFSACISLTSIYLPETLTYIGDSAFSYCSALLRADIPDRVMTMGKFCFYACTSLGSVTIGKSLTAVDNNAFHGCSLLYSVTFAEDSALKTIGDRAFLDCAKLSGIVIPNGVTLIDSYAFAGCSSITSIVFPDSVTTIKDAAFHSCSSLSSVTIGKGLRTMDLEVFIGTPVVFNQYENCNYLGNTENPYIVLVSCARRAYQYNVHADTKTIAAGAFDSSFARTISLPEGLERIGYGAFKSCRFLQSITIPSTVLALQDMTFDNCQYLTSVTLPETLTYIGRFAFRDCFSLATITIPNRVEVIEGGAFANCAALETFVLGAGIKEIKQEVFADAGVATINPDGTEGARSINVYYKGTAAGFALVNVGEANNEAFLNGSHYFYSETEPTSAGNYWHYGADGEVVVWGAE